MELIQISTQNLTKIPGTLLITKKGQSENLKVGYFILVTFFLLLIIQIRRKFKRKCGDSKKIAGLEVIRGPKPFFIKLIGNALDFLPVEETLTKCMAWHKLYGPCIKTTGVYRDILIVFSAEMAQAFLKSGDLDHVSKKGMPFYEIMKPFLGNGLLVAEGSHWQNRRKVLMKSMSFQSLRSYTKLLNKHSKRFVISLEKLFGDNEVHQINVLINSSFLAIITEIVTGSEFEDQEGVEYHHSFQTWKESLLKRIKHVWCLYDFFWRFHPKYRAHNEAIESMNCFAKRRLEEHKLRRQKQMKLEENGRSEADVDDDGDNNSDPEEDEKFRCTLDELIDVGVSEEDIIFEINTLLFGGHETTATTIHFFFFLMALNPQYQKLCRQEIDQVFEDPLQAHNGNLTYEALSCLIYLERCFLETMRLYPSAFAFMRCLKKSLNIDYEGKSVVVPAGTDIVIGAWVIHRNADYYPNPQQFDPDRFLPEECAKRHSYAYLPFSAGPRNCIGLKFGMNEMKTVAAYVLRNFELSTTDKLDDVTLLPNMTLTPQRDYNFMLKKRTCLK